jgi:nicotinate-nucleotide--dimethylbenzimidazole phosphoribosyltransferase
VNKVAEQVGARIRVLDAGIAAEMDPHSGLTVEKVGRGTDDATTGPAMSLMQVVMAIETGIRAVQQEAEQGVGILGLAGMGLGSVTSAAMVVAAISGRAVAELVPQARSEHREERARAIAAADRALTVNRPEQHDMLDIVSKVGGFEIGAIAGIALGAALRRVPVVVDGLVAAAGALVAGGLNPLTQGALIASHGSAGGGQRVALQMLRLRPCLAMALPVDGGIGALLAMPIVEAAARLWTGAESRVF